MHLDKLKSGLMVLELEDRLEMVQLSALAEAPTRRCDRESCDEPANA